MDIKQLNYFYVIAEEGQITSAAKRLHISQPPLSYQLKCLEEELGVKLIERGSRHIKLTDAGRILYKQAEEILNLTRSTMDKLKGFKEGDDGTISIGTVSSSGAALLNSRLTVFHNNYPNINFEIHEGNTFQLLEKLHKGLIEIAIVRTPFNSLGLNSIYLPKEKMVAAMRKDFNFTENKIINIHELNNKPLIFYRRFESLILKACEDSNFEPYVYCKNDDARTTLLWANAGLGIAIVPKSVVELIASSDMIYKEIDNEDLTTRLAVVWSKNGYISSAAKNFLNIFREK